MENNHKLREILVNLLVGVTHMSFEEAIADYPFKSINNYPPNVIYTPWQLLEHIRINQNDILDFITNPKYQEKNWPDDYWPKRDKMATPKEWGETIKQIISDRNKLIAIIHDPKVDLNKKIEWGDGQTIIEEILKTADHTSYHIGEFGILRQIMNTWPKDRTA